MKIKYMDDKREGWMNNQTVYLVDKKNKEVDIYSSTPPKNQKKSHEFAFNQNDYKYSISNHSATEYALNLSLKKGAVIGNAILHPLFPHSARHTVGAQCIFHPSSHPLS